jgi:hypothetical protein
MILQANPLITDDFPPLRGNLCLLWKQGIALLPQQTLCEVLQALSGHEQALTNSIFES